MIKLINIIKGVFPNTVILLLYYGGSIAYGLNSKNSDTDVTVVLDEFLGNMYLNVGGYDLFIFSKESFIQRQRFDNSISAYYRSAADNIMSIDRTLIYINPMFMETLDELLIYDDKEFMLNHIEAELEYGKMRYEANKNLKSHYHVFRIRGMLEHYKNTGKYELIVEEPWYTKMIIYKQNWNNQIGKKYIREIKDQLKYLEDYLLEMKQNGLE